MSFRLTHDESIPRGIRRVAREEIDAAIQNLRVKSHIKRDEAVHDARKSLKKLRSLLRLIGPGAGVKTWKEDTPLRDLARSLSHMRDAAAMIETVGLLTKRYRGRPAAKEFGELRTLFVQRRAEAREKAEEESAAESGIVILRGLRRRLNDWRLDDDLSSMQPGLKKIYRRGRTALSRARKHPDSEHLHTLRKRVKDYWYQVRLLESVWPEGAGNPEPALRHLQECLGDAHNLAVLRDGTHSDGVTALIDDFEKELREKAFESAARVFEKKPGDHVRELSRLWQAWRKEPARKSPKSAGEPPARAVTAA